MKKIIKTLFILLLVALVAYAAALFSGLLTKAADDEDVIPFRTEIISRGNIANIITATGALSPEEEVNIGTQVSGQITKLYVKLNDEVKAGQLLAEIDPSIAETQLKQSKAALETSRLSYELAQKNYERTKTLVAKEYVAKVEIENAWQNVVSSKNSLESAKIAVERDEVNLGYTKVTSPIDGVIVAQEVASGQTLASNFQTPNLFRIAKDLTVMKIDMNVPESDISKIHEGMPVNFAVDAFPERNFPGVVRTINLNPNNSSGVVTYVVVVIVDNKDRALFPGMTANINITLSEVKDVLRVPAAALRFTPPYEDSGGISRLFIGTQKPRAKKPPRQNISQNVADSEGNKKSIYLWKNGALEEITVEVGATDDLLVEIKGDNIKEGDIVVTGLKIQED